MKPHSNIKFLRFNFLALLANVAPPLSAQTNTFPSSGNVGVGTTSPGGKLEIYGVANQLFLSGSAAEASMRFNPATGTVWQLGTALTAPNTFEVFENGIGTKLAITSGGNVGIGTTGPSRLLYLKKNSVSNPGYNPVLGLGYDDAEVFGGSVGLRVIPGNARQGLKISSNLNLTFHSPATGGNPAFQWQVGTVSDESTDSAVAMTMTGGGNVGIGTASPTNTLDVKSTGSSTVIGLKTGAQAADAFRLMDSDGSLRLSNGATANLVALVGENVGIGTTNPTQKLSVNGTIRAKEVVVDTGWSDYVFDESYKLKALSEVEAYVKTEHHLPGVPSAAQVAKEGIPVGEMQSRLLAKVEELTLHLIAQEKQLAAQSTRIEKLEAENTRLRRTP